MATPYAADFRAIQRGGYPEDIAERALAARAEHVDTARSAALMPGESCPAACSPCDTAALALARIGGAS